MRLRVRWQQKNQGKIKKKALFSSMLDFQALNAARQQVKNTHQQQQSQAQAHYQTSLQLILEYTDTLNPALLSQAMEAIKASLALRSNQAEPYTVLAYIFSGLGKQTEALKYFKQAQALNPDLPLLKTLQGILSSGHSNKEQEQPVSVHSNEDNLYHETERLISEATHWLMAVQNPPKQPQASEVEKSRFEALFAQLEARHQTMTKQVHVLESSMDVSALCAQLFPFEIVLKEWGQVIALSDQFIRLQTQIFRLAKRVQDLASELLSAPEKGQTHLEDILDQCDALADELDALAQKGHTIQALEAPYNALLQQVTEVQDEYL